MVSSRSAELDDIAGSRDVRVEVLVERVVIGAVSAIVRVVPLRVDANMLCAVWRACVTLSADMYFAERVPMRTSTTPAGCRRRCGSQGAVRRRD